LNESNWAAGSFNTTPAKARFSKDLAYRHFRKGAFCPEPHDITQPANTDSYLLPLDGIWHVPEDSSGDTLSYTFDSVGGNVYICAKGFIQKQGTGNAGPVLMGLRVNGAFIPESLCGNEDIAEYSRLESTGMQHWFTAMSEITIPVSPGRTTVDVVFRFRPDKAVTGRFQIRIGTRSLILWEIAR
jgi:hypothetical protein